MTIQYIKQLNTYLKKAKSLKNNPNRDSICYLDKEVRAFCGNDYIPFKLSSTYAKFYGSSRSIAEMQADVDSIIAALSSKISEIPKSSEILNVLNDIDQIEVIIPSDLDSRFSPFQKFINHIVLLWNLMTA